MSARCGRAIRRAGVSVAAAAVSLGGGWLFVSAPAVAAPTTQQFDFTGAAQQFTVPANVCQITVDAHGAQGGAGGPNDAPEGDGALGGRATTALSVTPGETLQVYVGGAGGDGTGSGEDAVGADGPGASLRFGNGDGAPGPGGFNGGGEGGFNSSPDEDFPVGGGGGGGASDVRRGGNGLSNRAVVAGGGGGGGVGDGDAPTPGGDGGDGGGATGEDGQTAVNPDPPPDPPGSQGGEGGTQAVGGGGGAGGSPGEDGIDGEGGDGAPGDEEAGGGGGGGLFGGGGGAGDFDEEIDAAEGAPLSFGGGKSVRAGANGLASEAGGGGGGGSGFGPAGVAFETGVREGDGVVTITYDPAAGGCPESVPTVVTVVAEPRFTG
jgi:hypothetical protein